VDSKKMQSEIVRAEQETLAGRCQAVRDAWEDFKAVFLEVLRRDLQATIKWIRSRCETKE